MQSALHEWGGADGGGRPVTGHRMADRYDFAEWLLDGCSTTLPYEGQWWPAEASGQPREEVTHACAQGAARLSLFGSAHSCGMCCPIHLDRRPDIAYFDALMDFQCALKEHGYVQGIATINDRQGRDVVERFAKELLNERPPQ